MASEYIFQGYSMIFSGKYLFLCLLLLARIQMVRTDMLSDNSRLLPNYLCLFMIDKNDHLAGISEQIFTTCLSPEI